MQRIIIQQTNMVKTQMHFLYVRTGVFPTIGISYTSSKSDIKPIDYVRNFVLDKHFLMQFLQTLDMTSDKLMIDWAYTQAISCCNMVNDRFLHSMCIYH